MFDNLKQVQMVKHVHYRLIDSLIESCGVFKRWNFELCGVG